MSLLICGVLLIFYVRYLLRGISITGEIALLLSWSFVLISLQRYWKSRQQHRYTVSYRQILDIIPQGSTILLRVKDSSDEIRLLLFRLLDLSQMPALLAELQGRMAASAV